MVVELKSNWRSAAELIAAISVVLSLLFVGYEIRLSRSVASNESSAASLEMENMIREYVSQYPSILARGCLNEELTADEEIVFSNIVRSIDRLGFFRNVRSGAGITGIAREFHATVVAKNRVFFPGFDRKWREIREVEYEYYSAWYDRVENMYTEIKAQNIQPLSDPSLCGF